MEASKIEIRELHWLMDMVHSIDVGLTVIDREYRISVWNSFMQNHSGKSAESVQGRALFDVFPEIPKEWFQRKAESVFLLKTKAFTTWEQRPFLFRFQSYRPITGREESMYQNVTLNPLVSASGEVNHICIILYDVTDIAVHKKELEAANVELAKLSRTDPLTQMNNRGYWEECLAAEFHRFKRYGTRSALVMFDIDFFKKVNDTYGHQAGDEVLRVVSKTLRKSIRTTDTAGRYGGEEFGVILAATNIDGGIFFAERLRKCIEKLLVDYEGEGIRFTISLGVAMVDDEMKSYQQWLESADQALYTSKREGRNRHTVAASFSPVD